MFINIIQKPKINMNIIYNYIIVKNIQGFIFTPWCNYTVLVANLISTFVLPW